MASRTKKTPAKARRRLSEDDRELVEEIAAMLPQPLTVSDRLAFSLLSAKVAEWLALDRALREHGATETNRYTGGTHLSANARREHEIFAEIVSLCREFGLTPMSRARLAARVGKKTEPAVQAFAGFISADPGKPME